MEDSDFRLFPLDLVALPGELVPLRIFEPRYRLMLGECLDGGHAFGIVRTHDGTVEEVGCEVEVQEVLERRDDGTFDVLCRGTRPFRLRSRRDDRPYPAGAVEFLDDKVEPVDERAVERAHEAYAELVREATDKEIEDERLQGMGAYAMAATVDFGPEAKQGLLELRSETARLRLCDRLFRAALRRLSYVERAQARAASNGKVRFG